MEVKKLDFIPEFHELANEFPFATDEELGLLTADMRINGYDKMFPIVIYEGKILDGRNRYLAADKADVTPVYYTFEGSFEAARELSKKLNLRRRNLNQGQIAVIAFRSGMSIRKAATEFGVGKSQISRVSALNKHSKEIVDDVFRGKLTLYAAERIVKKRMDMEKIISEEIKNAKANHESKIGLEAQAKYEEYKKMSRDELAWTLTVRDFSDNKESEDLL